MSDIQVVDGQWGKKGVRDESVAFIFDVGPSCRDLLTCPQRFPKFVEVTSSGVNPVCAINGARELVSDFNLKYHFKTFGYEPSSPFPVVPGIQEVTLPKTARYTWIMDWLIRNTTAREFAWVGADGCDPSDCPPRYLATWFHQKKVASNPTCQVVRPGVLRPGPDGWKQYGEGETSEYEIERKSKWLLESQDTTAKP